MPASDQGIRLDRYMLIPRTLIFLRNGGKVLLLKGSPQKRLWANLYNGIGGHLEKGEDVLSAARRELKEETGLVCDDLWICGTIIVDAGEHVGVGIYVLTGTNPCGTLVRSNEGDLEWIDIDHFHALPLVEDLKVVLPKVIKMHRGDVPFSARSYYDSADRLMVEFS